MLAITNSVTPQNLNKRFKLPTNPTTGINDNLKQNQVLATKEQLTRPKHNFMINQGSELKKALLNG